MTLILLLTLAGWPANDGFRPRLDPPATPRRELDPGIIERLQSLDGQRALLRDMVRICEEEERLSLADDNTERATSYRRKIERFQELLRQTDDLERQMRRLPPLAPPPREKK